MSRDAPASPHGPADPDSLIESFADALWMERGLSANTLAAYQSDLRAFGAWLARSVAWGWRGRRGWRCWITWHCFPSRA
jgi:hypothetical protein